jgi:hypothetical protein
MKSALSHFFSWIFLPLLMPTYGLLLTLYIPSEQIQLDKLQEKMQKYQIHMDLVQHNKI